MKTILFATGNEGKLREAQEILGAGYTVHAVKVDVAEVQQLEGKAVVAHKAREAFSLVRQPVLVEDTALYIEAWRGLPGAFVRWFLETVGCEGICRMLGGEKNRRVWAESALALYDGKTIKVVAGRVEGSIPSRPKGEYRFGWDPIFIPKGYKKTFAEMGPEEKNKISMRRKALTKLKRSLSRYF
ncbi:MAG: RdgB/HAM1 family non-canonical purine NTP pyrophosphatase [bacterium]|nr:RdgB/HAM1 family non-canonical purine NTP pyrophosphatase [bacterium]MDZ4296462.1 RdgB/HAM1 family non-canonical purine NTP pyrophosphatase [Patescibacteria group bacterium]